MLKVLAVPFHWHQWYLSTEVILGLDSKLCSPVQPES